MGWVPIRKIFPTPPPTDGEGDRGTYAHDRADS